MSKVETRRLKHQQRIAAEADARCKAAAQAYQALIARHKVRLVIERVENSEQGSYTRYLFVDDAANVAAREQARAAAAKATKGAAK